MPGPLVDPRGLRGAIAREEARLLHLQTELSHAQARLAELKTTLAAHEGPVEISPVAPSTALEKVALFRPRFRGRDDIYPRFWSNARTGRKGYAPACGNEWIRGVCEKPRVKCGECPNQAFLPVEDKVILDHLQLARMFKKRLRGYRTIGYDRDCSGTQSRREVDNALETRDLAEASDGDE